MLNDLFRTYKKIIIFVLILLSAVVFWFYGCHRQKSTKELANTWEEISLSKSGGTGYRFKTPELSGNVIFGTRGYIARDKTAPVLMEISCKEDSFTGTLRITLPGIDGKGVAYQSAVNCKKGVKSRVVMEVPDLGNVSWFSFELLDSFGTVRFAEDIICKKKTKENTTNIRDIYIGVLSRRYDRMEYMENQIIKIKGEETCIHLVRFLQHDFPTDKRELSCLSAVLVDGFDVSRLSQIQKECLLEWVSKKEGVLLLAAGSEADFIVSPFETELGLRMEKVEELLYDFSTELSRTGNIKLTSASLELSEDWSKIGISVPCSAYRKSYGEGNVFLLTYSLTDDTFLQWTGRDPALELFLQDALEGEIGHRQSGNTSLWYIKKALYAFMNARHPNTFYYALFFIVYLLVLGFFAYYLLRKIKKREYIWFVVPAISLIFTLGLAFRSGGVRQESGREFSALRVRDAANGQDDYYFLYQNNEGEAGNVDLVPDIKRVEPLDYVYQSEAVDSSALQTISQDYTINNAKNGFDIAFEETVPGSSYILKCSGGTAGQEQGGCFETDIHTMNACFEGEIENVSRWNFKKVVLIRGRQYYIVNGMKAGERRTIKKDEVAFWTGYKEETGLFGNEDEMTALGNMVEYLQQRYILENDDWNTILMVGITDENDFRLFSGGDTLGNHLTVFVDRCALPETKGEECIVNINTSCPEGEENGALAYDILEKNETKVTYRFDASRVVWGMFRNRDGFEGTIYAYNYRTGGSDVIFEKEDEEMNCGQLEPYVSDMNKMILTFCLPQGSNYGGAPVLSVILKE